MDDVILVNLYETVDDLRKDMEVNLSIDHSSGLSSCEAVAWLLVALLQVDFKRLRAELHLNHHVNRNKLLTFLQKVVDGLSRKLGAAVDTQTLL